MKCILDREKDNIHMTEELGFHGGDWSGFWEESGKNMWFQATRIGKSLTSSKKITCKELIEIKLFQRKLNFKGL